jgi:hypothetical protein
VRRELVVEEVSGRRVAMLANGHPVRVLERVGRVHVGAVDLGDEDFLPLPLREPRSIDAA